MKKSFSMILAAALLLTLTACNNSGDSSNSSVEASAPRVSSAANTENSSAPAASGSTDTTVSDDPIIVPDDPNNPADPGGDPVVDNSGLDLPDNRAGRMVKAALAEGEWGAMMLVEEDAIASVTGVDPADLDEFACVMPMISAVPNEVYCVKPKDGKSDTVRTSLANLITAKQEDHMMYPMVAAAWENAVLEEDGGYVYLVVHPDNAQAAADTMGATK